MTKLIIITKSKTKELTHNNKEHKGGKSDRVTHQQKEQDTGNERDFHLVGSSGFSERMSTIPKASHIICKPLPMTYYV